MIDMGAKLFLLGLLGGFGIGVVFMALYDVFYDYFCDLRELRKSFRR